jgi:hypothetical protein
MHIEILPVGEATTDYDALERLTRVSRVGMRLCQDVLVAVGKVDKPILFGLLGSGHTRLQSKILALRDQLKLDAFRPELSDAHRVLAFFNTFAKAAPNWQEEYAYLNRYIPDLLGR